MYCWERHGSATRLHSFIKLENVLRLPVERGDAGGYFTFDFMLLIAGYIFCLAGF